MSRALVLDCDMLWALPCRLDEFAPLTIPNKKNDLLLSIYAKTCSWRTKVQNPINWRELVAVKMSNSLRENIFGEIKNKGAQSFKHTQVPFIITDDISCHGFYRHNLS